MIVNYTAPTCLGAANLLALPSRNDVRMRLNLEKPGWPANSQPAANRHVPGITATIGSPIRLNPWWQARGTGLICGSSIAD